jgi:hypothetical protein
VIENNVTEFVLGKAKVTDKVLPFDELMTATDRAVSLACEGAAKPAARVWRLFAASSPAPTASLAT